MPERLSRIGEVLNGDVAEGKIPGAVIATTREGKLVFLEAYGFRDKAAGVPMATDTIFNIASMTKPTTTVAALTLVEQGGLVINEPAGADVEGRFAESKVAVLDESARSPRAAVPAP